MDKITYNTKILQAANVLLGYLKLNNLDARVNLDGSVSVNGSIVRIGTGYLPGQLDLNDLRSNQEHKLERALGVVAEYLTIPTLKFKRPNHSGIKRGTLENSFEPVIFREKTFQNAPNPDPKLIKKWMPVAFKHARNAWYRYARHLLSFGYEKEDMESISLVHLTTFLHRYATGQEDTDNKNLHRFMKQRMTEVVYKIRRKATGCSCDWSQRVDMEQLMQSNSVR